MRRMQVFAFLALSSCATAPSVMGPGVPRDAQIDRITVEPLDPAYGKTAVISDRPTLDATLPLFDASDWTANDGMPLSPHYRVTLRGRDGHALTYFLGSFSDPPRAPCFVFCTGSWLAASSAEGKPVADKYRALATSGDLQRIEQLLSATDATAP